MIIKFNLIHHSLDLLLRLFSSVDKKLNQKHQIKYPLQQTPHSSLKRSLFSIFLYHANHAMMYGGVVEPIFHKGTMERAAVGQKLNILGTQFGQGSMQGPSLKLKCRLQHTYYYMPPAEYCALCTFPYKQMGACPAPEKSDIYAYLSILPYLIPFFYLILALLRRNFGDFKVAAMLASGYILADKLCKPIFKSPRPDFSCKTSYGMPSSHMVVMATFAFFRIKESNRWGERIFWVLMTVGEGVARMQLNYHTLEQVIAGTVFGVFYVFLFEGVFSKFFDYVMLRLSKVAQRSADGDGGTNKHD